MSDRNSALSEEERAHLDFQAARDAETPEQAARLNLIYHLRHEADRTMTAADWVVVIRDGLSLFGHDATIEGMRWIADADAITDETLARLVDDSAVAYGRYIAWGMATLAIVWAEQGTDDVPDDVMHEAALRAVAITRAACAGIKTNGDCDV